MSAIDDNLVTLALRQRDMQVQLTELQAQNVALTKAVSDLTIAVNAQRESVSGLITAWESAKGLPGFIRWVAAVVAGGIALVNVIKYYSGT